MNASGTGSDQKTPLEKNIELREFEKRDLPIFFEQQLDLTANYMAAFTRKEPADWEAFLAHWKRILTDDSISIRTILFDDQVAGHVLTFVQFGEREVSYWLGREFWGKGIATKALLLFLVELEERPIFARRRRITSRRSGC
jgi:RimJ/RimL family protein N-acetyltransferase